MPSLTRRLHLGYPIVLALCKFSVRNLVWVPSPTLKSEETCGVYPCFCKSVGDVGAFLLKIYHTLSKVFRRGSGILSDFHQNT